jgi:4-hydroxy-tetrahydrodipicolinate synthase
MCLLGLMRPDTRLPIVELAETAKAEVESALAEMGEEDLASGGWEDVRSQRDAAAT